MTLRNRLQRLEAVLNPPPESLGLAARMRERARRTPAPLCPLSEVPRGTLEWRMRMRAMRRQNDEMLALPASASHVAGLLQMREGASGPLEGLNS